MFDKKVFMKHLREQAAAAPAAAPAEDPKKKKKPEPQMSRREDAPQYQGPSSGPEGGTPARTTQQQPAPAAATTQQQPAPAAATTQQQPGPAPAPAPTQTRPQSNEISPERMARRAELAMHQDRVRATLVNRSRARRGMKPMDPSEMLGTEASRRAAAEAAGVEYVPRWQYGKGGQRLSVSGGQPGGGAGGGAGGGQPGGGQQGGGQGLLDTLGDAAGKVTAAVSDVWERGKQAVGDAASVAGQTIANAPENISRWMGQNNFMGISRPVQDFWSRYYGQQSGVPGMAAGLGAGRVWDLQQKQHTGPVVDPNAGPQMRGSGFTRDQVTSDPTLGQKLGASRGTQQEVETARGDVGAQSAARKPGESAQNARLRIADELGKAGKTPEEIDAELVRLGLKKTAAQAAGQTVAQS